MSDLLRVYRLEECKKDGYPQAWREINAAVVEEAGSRCLRCLHPYRKGENGSGEWSRCDRRCVHGDPIRVSDLGDAWLEGSTAGIARRTTGEIVAEGWAAEARWRILTVHHLNGDKADCRWWNLAALCQRCHLTIQGKVKLEHPWPWPHSEWFQVFAAGFYASHHLGLELSREEAEARLGELLALGAEEAAIERMPL